MKFLNYFFKIKWIIKNLKYKSIGKNFNVHRGFNINNLKNVSIGKNFYAGNNCRLLTYEKYNEKETGYNPRIIIGENVILNEYCFISCLNSVEIGNNCLLGDNVFITDNYHGSNSKDELEIPPINRDLYSKGKVKIGNNVWIGRNVCIMPGVTIGDNVIIGANSVVTHSYAKNTVIAGCPAKKIR